MSTTCFLITDKGKFLVEQKILYHSLFKTFHKNCINYEKHFTVFLFNSFLLVGNRLSDYKV